MKIKMTKFSRVIKWMLNPTFRKRISDVNLCWNIRERSQYTTDLLNYVPKQKQTCPDTGDKRECV